MMAYTVTYKMHEWSPEKKIVVLARNKEAAFEAAVWEAIPGVEGFSCSSCWVSGVTYNNGNYRTFPRP